MADQEQRERESLESAEDKFHERVDEERTERGEIAEDLAEDFAEDEKRTEQD